MRLPPRIAGTAVDIYANDFTASARARDRCEPVVVTPATLFRIRRRVISPRYFNADATRRLGSAVTKRRRRACVTRYYVAWKAFPPTIPPVRTPRGIESVSRLTRDKTADRSRYPCMERSTERDESRNAILSENSIVLPRGIIDVQKSCRDRL